VRPPMEGVAGRGEGIGGGPDYLGRAGARARHDAVGAVGVVTSAQEACDALLPLPPLEGP